MENDNYAGKRRLGITTRKGNAHDMGRGVVDGDEEIWRMGARS